jgi:glycosyltransferase involved in cell wall biosynthesis
MKLLILTNNPERSSFRQRIEVYLEAMAEKGIKTAVEAVPRSLPGRWKVYAKAREFDGVLLHKKGLHLLEAPLLRKHARTLIFTYDDAVWLNHKHPDRRSRSRLLPWRRSVRIADMVIVGSPYLAQFGRVFNAQVRVVPIGLRVADYKSALPKPADRKVRLVWIGSKSTLTYLRGIRAAIEELGKRHPNLVLRQIGDAFFDLDSIPVEKFQWFAAKRGEYLSACDIGLAPLPDNPYTRGKCSFKVLEYAAAGLPVVASPVGTNSDYILHGRTGFLASQREDWIKYVGDLIQEESLRQEMGAAAQSHAAQYDISVIGDQLCAALKEALCR